MRHVILGILAALISAAITVSIHVWGAHDMQGLLAAVAGYPGLLANGDYVRLNLVLFTVVNWLFYFVLFECAVLIQKKTLKTMMRSSTCVSLTLGRSAFRSTI